ncbi:hypothetical protein PISMIDRAFT_681856 [Pisolithus microcarpus 441]|uniref:Uncharacterized protein n=1 Tax=Pisolithus microcarpus 441 TaxID=765257 RepID=A0A0C9Z3X5_9AGAM|nr:hypothetical protein PISMIDRAFT_681856 [Pisolithus microcarpus 441]
MTFPAIFCPRCDNVTDIIAISLIAVGVTTSSLRGALNGRRSHTSATPDPRLLDQRPCARSYRRLDCTHPLVV